MCARAEYVAGERKVLYSEAKKGLAEAAGALARAAHEVEELFPAI
jgi:hypothetical protein